MEARKPTSFTKVLLLGAIALVLAWRIVVINIGDQFAQDDVPEDAESTLRWDPRHPKALLFHGMALTKSDPAEAKRTLQDAIRANPAEGRSYAALARLHEAENQLPAAERAMDMAAKLSPLRTDVQGEVAAFWMRRGNTAKAMEHWNVVLTFGRDSWTALFPDMLKLADDPATLAAFRPLLEKPLPWWPSFFAYAASNAQKLETVRSLYALQAKGPNDATPEALKAFLDRLQREGFWTDAYLVWLNSLENDELRAAGNLFNGGFEQPLSNLGFDWIFAKAPQVFVESAATYGASGTRALHVEFRGSRVAFRHLGQYLLLPPGTYSMRGRVRPEGLETVRGVQWSVHCLGQEEALGTSEAFLGTEQWRHFGFRFTVPGEACKVQLVRLELAGRVALDFQAKGEVWFDDLALERLSLD